MSALKEQAGGDHYKKFAIQPVEFIQANNLSFLEGCVIKRLCRHSRGGKGRQDIEKAIHELQLLLELQYQPAISVKSEPIFRPWNGENSFGPSEVGSTCTVVALLRCGEVDTRPVERLSWTWDNSPTDIVGYYVEPK